MSCLPPKRVRIQLALLIALVAVLSATHQANQRLEIYRAAALTPGHVGPLPDGKVLRVASLGFDRLLADLFWLRTAYYMGDERSHNAGYPSAGALAQLVTDIDPSFQTVYVLMSGALSGLRGDPDAAIALLEKGVENVSYWKLHFLLGFNYYLERMDYARAAVQIQAAADLGDGPSYLPLFAARLYAQSGDPKTAIAFIQARLREVSDPGLRQQLEKRYWDLWINRDLAQIDSAISGYKSTHAAEPTRVEALVEAGFLEKAPIDPRGGTYRISGGRAVTDLEYDRLELHHIFKPTASEYNEQYERMRAEQEGKQ